MAATLVGRLEDLVESTMK
jgi:hypothetical protein